MQNQKLLADVTKLAMPGMAGSDACAAWLLLRRETAPAKRHLRIRLYLLTVSVRLA